MAILIALVASVLYGTSDFFGALGARRLGLMASTAVVHVLATVALLALWPLAPGAWSIGTLVAGLVAGVLALVGMLAFYASLAIGPMSVMSPLIAVIGAVVPVVAALVTGDRFGPLTIGAIVVAVAAAALVSIERGEGSRVRPRALVLGLVAGLALGGSLVAIHAAPAGSGLIPGILEIAVGVGSLLVFVAVRRLPVFAGGIRPLLVSSIGGVLLGAADAGIVLALAAGDLAIVSVLVCLYPVVTVVLATVVTRERIAPVQIAGVALAVVASVVLSFSG